MKQEALELIILLSLLQAEGFRIWTTYNVMASVFHASDLPSLVNQFPKLSFLPRPQSQEKADQVLFIYRAPADFPNLF